MPSFFAQNPTRARRELRSRLLDGAKGSIKRLRPGIVEDTKQVVRALAQHRPSRAALNRLYDRLDYEHKAAFAVRFSWIFHGSGVTLAPSTWSARFAGKSIRLALGQREAWLEWMLALSLLGHDVAVKRTYEALLRGASPPKVFLDVGANFGLHALLLACHGVRTFAFEPNVTCHAFLREACALNGVTCEIEGLALDEREGERDFWFPETATWLGTLDPMVAERLNAEHALRQARVPTSTLDAYVRTHGLRPDLVKIDAEGSELRIVNGALETLHACRPLVIFECWPERAGREELSRLFREARYRVVDLPLPSSNALDMAQFVDSPRNDFLAAPEERLQSGALRV